MKSINRGTFSIAIFLIILGIGFLIINFIPGISGISWPVICFIFSLLFCIPSVAWPLYRRARVALYMPAGAFTGLGLMLLYSILSGDYVAWAYGWTLIPGGMGLGLSAAAWAGHWGRGVAWVGLWIMLINLILFSFFGTLFGGPSLKMIAPGLLVFTGFIMLFTTLIQPRKSSKIQ
jgi:hypothetical protein